MITTAVLAAADSAGGFSWKTLLTFVGAAIMLAFFSSLGILARLRDRRVEERKAAQLDQQKRQRDPHDEPGS